MLKDLSHLLTKAVRTSPTVCRSHIQTTVRFGRVRHMCSGCLKEHQTHDQAQQCVCRCFGGWEFAQSTNHDLSQNGLIIAKTMVNVKADGHAKLSALSESKSMVTTPGVFQDRIIDPIKSAAASSDVINLMAAIQRDTPRSDVALKPTQIQFGNESKAFSRADAAYKCKGCAEKYFTRNEVESCFATHEQSLP